MFFQLIDNYLKIILLFIFFVFATIGTLNNLLLCPQFRLAPVVPHHLHWSPVLSHMNLQLLNIRLIYSKLEQVKDCICMSPLRASWESTMILCCYHVCEECRRVHTRIGHCCRACWWIGLLDQIVWFLCKLSELIEWRPSHLVRFRKA